MPRRILTTKERADQFYNRLKTYVLSLPPGSQLPTISQFREGFNADLKEDPHVARIALDRLHSERLIETRGKAGTYVLERPEQVSVAPRPLLIGLVTPAPSDFVSRLITGIADSLHENTSGRPMGERCRLICANSGTSAIKEMQLVEEMSEEVDGLLVLPTPADTDDLRVRQVTELGKVRRKKPTYLVGASINDGSLSFSGTVVAYPEKVIAQRIVAHVKKLGRLRHIFILGEYHNKALVERASTIEWELHQEKCSSTRVLPKVADNTWPWHTPQELGEHYIVQMMREGQIAKSKPPDLLICTTDLVAFGVLHKLRVERFRVPDHVMVMGVDGDNGGKHFNPRLTSMELSPERLGALAVGALLAEINNKAEPAESVLDLSDAIGNVYEGETTVAINRAPAVSSASA